MLDLTLLTLFISFLCVSNVFSQTCNQLNSDNDGYLNYSSPNQISSLCSSSDNSSSYSLWEEYQCSYISGRPDECWPRRYFSSCSPGELRGIAFLFHGYSACSDQYTPIIPLLQDECFHVYLPCTVGHGLNYCSYDENSTDSDISPDCTENGYNLTELPTSRVQYIEFIDMMNEIMADEVIRVKDCETSVDSSWNINNDKFETLLGGLSLGASLSATAGLRSYLYDMVWTKQVLMSPFLGMFILF